MCKIDVFWLELLQKTVMGVVGKGKAYLKEDKLKYFVCHPIKAQPERICECYLLWNKYQAVIRTI